MGKRILIIGAHGMLGRPVARRLVADGHEVRAMARHPDAAASLLPGAVKVVPGDLENVGQIDHALQDCDAAYISVDSTSPKGFSPETDGLTNLIQAMQNHDNPRLFVLSALGTSTAAVESSHWWHLKVKQEAQKIAMQSGLPWTILEPAWYMESLPLFISGSRAMTPSKLTIRSYWISGHDFGGYISTMLGKNRGAERIIPCQGTEYWSLDEALRQFVLAYDATIKPGKVPLWMLRAGGLFVSKVDELVKLLEYYSEFTEPAPNPDVLEEFGEPQMSFADYAAYVRDTGDLPRK